MCINYKDTIKDEDFTHRHQILKGGKIIEKILDLLFPQVCGICGKLNENSLCKKCEIILKKQAKFGIEAFEKEEFIIQKSGHENKYFDELLYIFKYEGIIRKTILDYKFNEKSYLYKTFVNFLLKNEKLFEKIKSYDTIIPVPISKKRMKKRGYNQSLLIAKLMAKNIHLELIDNCLIKTKNIIEQSKLNKKQRLENIKNAYVLKNRKRLENKKILLIDDIYTTGSTVNECSRILSLAKLQKIGVLTIAKD